MIVSSHKANLRWLTVSLVVAAPAAFASCETSLPMPALYPQSSSETVAKVMRVSGTPTSACRFSTDTSIDKVMDFYRREFGVARVETRRDDILIIARPSGEHWQTVQLRGNAHRTHALVSSANFKQGLAALNQPIGQPLPGGSKVISDVEMEDPPGKQARVLAIQNTSSVEANIDFLTNSLRERGYRVDRTLKAGLSPADGTSVWLTAPGKDAVIVVKPLTNRQTSVVMNFVQSTQELGKQ